jgi:hypothetical protein
VARGYLLLDLGRLEEARQQYERARAGQPFFRPLAESVLLLAGEGERVAANAAQMLAGTGATNTDDPRGVIEYLAGRGSADELIAGAKTQPSLCSAYFWIGLSSLLRGDRAAARQHFEQSVSSGAHFSHAYQWSRAFRARLERDPHWPAWITGEGGGRQAGN